MKTKLLILPVFIFFLLYTYSNGTPLENALKSKRNIRTLTLYQFDSKAEVLFQKYNCLSCHSIYPPSRTAPSFLAIKRRYMRYFNGDIKRAKEFIKNRIINGSRGNWFRFRNFRMPPYPNIPDKELDALAEAILKLGL